MKLLPLFAAKSMSDPLMQCNDRFIDVTTFLGDVITVAKTLPSGRHVINLCENHYYFFVGFVAALIQKKVSILPQHQKATLLLQLQQNYSNSYTLTDAAIQLLLDKPEKFELEDMPMIDSRQTACIFFTSGSTAIPAAHEKQWGDLTTRAEIVAAELGLNKEKYCLVATMPPQHLFGFEHMVMLSLQTKVVLHSRRPFFPNDMRQVLTSVKFSPYIISTPYHLSCFVRSGISMPSVNNILSSTAPLSMCLAKNIETLFKSTLIEIYGCTETGAVAMRRTAMEEHWQLIKGLKPSHQDDECYIEDTQAGKIAVLPDVVEWHSENSFSLIARKEDNINIAGKRSSKLYLTKCLNAIEGVQDAVVYIPKTEVDIARIIALVVAPLISEQVIKNELQNSVDNLFMPRQIIKVDAIPRNEAGKVTQQDLLNLILACSEQQAVFKIDKSHPALPGHFPNNPLVPGVVTLDNIIACFRQISPEFKLRQLIQIKFHEKLRAEQRCVVKFSLHRKGVQFKAFVKQKLVISGIFNL